MTAPTTCRAVFALLLLALFAPVLVRAAPPSGKALALRDRGLAELENERPKDAETSFRRLREQIPGDPLPGADLAIALLRQQRYEEALAAIDAALGMVRGDGHLLAIRGNVLEWRGDADGALAAYRAAALAAPDDVQILFALHQHATNIDASEDATHALDALSRLRPDNVVVLLELAQHAVAAGQRSEASRALLRLEELIWQAPELAQRELKRLRTALEGDDLAAARVPAKRLENVLKVTPMFREGLRELRPGILGLPVERFREEPAPSHFGSALPVRLEGRSLDTVPTRSRALAVADLDGDRRPDIARVRAGREKQPDTLEVRLARDDWRTSFTTAAAGMDILLATDIDNDGALDLVAAGAGAPSRALRGDGQGGFAVAEFGLEAMRARAVVAIDFDIEGDLDLAFAGVEHAGLLRNNLAGPLEAVGTHALPAVDLDTASAMRATDLDRDGDLDLLIAHGSGLLWLDNLRQGRFTDRTASAGLADAPPAADVVSADLDNDGWPDLVTAGRGLRAWHNRHGRFEPWTLLGLPTTTATRSLIAFDADNDGRLDLATAGADVRLYTQAASGRFIYRRLRGGPVSATALAASDLDGDGDLDLVAAGPAGLRLLMNEGGNVNHHLSVRLRGLVKGNSKNNVFGVGSVIEVRDGRAYQFREVTGDVVHLGLGQRTAADVLRVVWTNGVPQNRLDVAAEQSIVEKQLLKGSCPFLYVWDGQRVRFVTDLLWGAPIGLPIAPGVYADSDPEELVRVDQAAAIDGSYDLRITEELWEAAFFDQVRLWVVDHPADVMVASSLRIVPGRGPVTDRVLATRDLRPLAAATDGRGRDVTEAVRLRDAIYASGYQPSPYQGVAARAWTFTLDLGEAPAQAIRLLLDGWIFPADASLNLAVAQRSDLLFQAPRLEVETAAGWQVLIENMGFPAGKTKTTVIDTPPLPAGARRLRIITNLWLHWDRIAWSTAPADREPVVIARLLPAAATLGYRGFSALVRAAPNAPHRFDYARVTRESPWLPFPGRYTRYGDVRPLLAVADDRSVILAPGDEIRLRFDAGQLPVPAPGWVRTLFLESQGWDKDADRNTGAGERMEPLPFHGMKQYPYDPAHGFPDLPENRAYRSEWLTRDLRDR